MPSQARAASARHLSCAFAATLALEAVEAPAQGDDANAAVTAETRSGSEVIVHGDESGGFVDRVNEADSRRELSDAASLLEPLAGLHVRRLGGDDAFSTVSIRGSTSNEVSVFFAGVPLTGGADPSLDLSSLPLWPSTRARVYRSFAPAVLGPTSLGGALVLDAPAAHAPTKTEVWAGGGSLGEARMRAADVHPVPFGNASGRIATALSASRSDDAYSYFNPGANRDVTRLNAGHAAVDGVLAVTRPIPYQDGREGELRIVSLGQARRQHLPGTTFAPTLHDSLDSSRTLTSVEIRLPTGSAPTDAEPDRGGLFRVHAWRRRDSLELRSVPNPYAGEAVQDDVFLAHGGALGWQGSILPRVVLNGVIDGSVEAYIPGDRRGAAAGPVTPATRLELGVGVDLEAKPARSWTVALSGRGDARSDSAEGPAAGSNVDRDLRPSGHLGTEVVLAPGVTVAAHGGALTRPPSFLERFGNRGQFVPNPALRPESALTVDGGVRAGRRGTVVWTGALSAFATSATDLIAYVVPSASGEPKASNIGRARLVGLEMEGDTRWRGSELHVSYTFLATANLAECAAQTGTVVTRGPLGCDRPSLPGRPPHDLVVDLIQHAGPFAFRYGLDVAAGMTADLAGVVVVPARALHSAGVRLDVPHAPGLRVAADVRNLFDLRTALYPGASGEVRLPLGDSYDFPIPGRTFLVSARYTVEPGPESAPP